jgi:hypothetical protein
MSRPRRILQTKLHFTISVDVTALNLSNTIRRKKLCNIRSKMALPPHLLIANRVLAVFDQLPQGSGVVANVRQVNVRVLRWVMLIVAES